MSRRTDSLAEALLALQQHCVAHGIVLTCAESCTGGGIAQALTALPGSSAWFDCAFVTYSNAAKMRMLAVLPATLAAHGAVSAEVAGQMAVGALRHSQASLACAVTGIAGPEGGTVEKPVGTVWFAWCAQFGQVMTECQHFSGARQAVRDQTVVHALQGCLRYRAGGCQQY